MGRGANLSILGLYQWDKKIFDGMSFPPEFSQDDKQTFIDNCIMECAELEILYPSWDFMRLAIEKWSRKELFTWNRLYAAMMADYNPIENYNRTEDMTEEHSGTDYNQASGSDTDTHTGYDSVTGSGKDTDTKSRTSFDSNTYAATEKLEMEKGSTQTNNHNSTITHSNGRRDDFTHGHKIETSGNISGNIGVTTSQQMLEQELEVVPKLNLINTMIQSFKNRFCILVY